MNYLIYLAIGYGISLISLMVLCLFLKSEIKRLHKEKDDLMNRFMARDFQQYAGGRHVIDSTPTDVELAEEALGVDEIDKEMGDRLSVV